MSNIEKFGFYEFFAGGGMARLGLGSKWKCLLANDVCPKKADAYRNNFGDSPKFIIRDVAEMGLKDFQSKPSLAWASFPCQDLSLAGMRRGLKARRSGTFWPFWEHIKTLNKERSPVPIIVLENVIGAISSHKGKDFQAILGAMTKIGYKFGPLVMDSVNFISQSRPRLFIIASKCDLIPSTLMRDGPTNVWHPKILNDSYERLPKSIKDNWVWWDLPVAPQIKHDLSVILEDNPISVRWHSKAETKNLLSLMSENNQRKVKEAQKCGRKLVGTIYRRTRSDKNGKKCQRAEVRFDQISGCLRTPAGGSSRQFILVVDGQNIRSRLLSSREAARLMGVPDSYKLPPKYNEAYHLMGDGLVVPVVKWLEKNILTPLAIILKKKGLMEAA
ncbi:MAG: DNA cytosine methyltransferase [Nitrospinales bacterium]